MSMSMASLRSRFRGRTRALIVGSAALVLCLAAFVPIALGTHRFPDVSNPQTHDAIDRVVDAGIMTSCDGVNFCPQAPLGRQWAALNYDRLLGLDGTARPFTPTFRSVNVQTGGNSAPLTVDSTLKVGNLNADRLDGFDASSLVRAAQGTGGAIDDFGTCDPATDLVTLQVNAPVDGILLVWSDIRWNWDADSPPGQYPTLDDLVWVDASLLGFARNTVDSADRYDRSQQSFATPVTAGAHTVKLQARECASGLAVIAASNVMTLFVPFGNDGGQGALSGR
jgi:hypothetical protein